MNSHPTKLVLASSGESVEAELHDDLRIDVFFEAEELWSAARVRFLRDCLSRGVKSEDLPQSIHWNWSLKAVRMSGMDLGPLSPYRLFGIKADEMWQGLLLGCCVGHVSKIAPLGRDLVYVDYIESAPWNWKHDGAKRKKRFKGVGRQLLELATQWSFDLDLRGRLGLHSLPQSEPFYRESCAMTDCGPDAIGKVPLRYFEFTEAQAKAFKGEK